MPDDLRHRYAEAIRAAADYPIIAEWICCEPVNPDHTLCVQGDMARKMLRAVLADDPEVLFLPSGVVDAVLAVRDEELERLRRDLESATATLTELAPTSADGWRERAETAELVIARAENLRDKWLAWPVGDMHHAAGLMLSKYLDGTAYGADEPRPAALDDTRKETGDGTARGV